MSNVHYPLSISNIHCIMSNAQCPISNIHYPLSIVHCPLSIVHCPLSIVHCPLSIVHLLLSIVYCPLYNVHCPLSVVQCPLTIVHCPMFNIQCPLYNVVKNFKPLLENDFTVLHRQTVCEADIEPKIKLLLLAMFPSCCIGSSVEYNNLHICRTDISIKRGRHFFFIGEVKLKAEDVDYDEEHPGGLSQWMVYLLKLLKCGAINEALPVSNFISRNCAYLASFDFKVNGWHIWAI